MSLAACSSAGLDHPLAGLAVAALGQVVLQDRGGRLLDLQEQRVALVAALQQGDEGPGADTAHPDHLAGHIDQLEPLQQPALVELATGPGSSWSWSPSPLLRSSPAKLLGCDLD
jgi:hypothetical protein